MPGPLDGVRIVEVTSVLLGPWAAQTLGDMGADVIKVEPPAGDTTRHFGPARNPGMASIFLTCNRNKRSIVLDLKHPDGLAALMKLCEGADVLLHNLRPGAAARLGMGYEQVKVHRPDIVYCATYGYRAAGPWAEYPAYDDIVQAASGVTRFQEMAGCKPHYTPTVIADKTTALTVVYAVTAALFHRERTGEGQAIEVPMFETMVSYMMAEHLYGRTFEPALGEAGYIRVLSPFRRPYETKDGYIAILPHTDAHWRAFLGAIDRLDILQQERFATIAARTRNINALYEELAGLMRERTTAEWLELLDPGDLPLMPLHSPDDLLENPQLEATGFWQMTEHPSEGTLRMTDPPVGFAASPSDVRRHAPTLGEHSGELLRELGYSDADIAGLAERGITKLSNG